MNKILLLPGDGIGPEVMEQAEKVLNTLIRSGFDVELERGDIGGIAINKHGDPFPDVTQKQAAAADAILLGAVGGPAWDDLAREQKPEAGLLRLRHQVGCFANFRPAFCYPQLVQASSLRPELIQGLDLLIIRELIGGIYFGEPRGERRNTDGTRSAFNTMIYSEFEIERIARVAFEAAKLRHKKVCSVDKANVLESSQLWREVVTRVAADYPGVQLTHMYVDNAAMQLVRWPKQFDVIVTENLFGDILSDCAAMLTGSIGMLPSAALTSSGKGIYEPVHGSAPDIAGQNLANPFATILSLSMMMRYSFKNAQFAEAIEKAVISVINENILPRDLTPENPASTSAIGDAVVKALRL
jgi:3-isopropylmalate dehydrogenase